MQETQAPSGAAYSSFLRHSKNESWIVFHIEFFQECHVFLVKRFRCMMSLLNFNIMNHCSQLRPRMRKGAKTLLPREPAGNPAFFVNEFGRAGLYGTHQIRK